MRSLVGRLADGRLAPVVESEPRLDLSRPSGLRLRGFLLTVAGALLIGVGSLSVWITVGIPNESAHTSLRGTDLGGWDGRVAFVCALLILIGVVLGRLVRSRRHRQMLAALGVASGVVAVWIAADFIAGGKDRRAVLQALGIPRAMWAELGAFRDLGSGPYLVLVGGVLCTAGALLTLWWARRTE